MCKKSEKRFSRRIVYLTLTVVVCGLFVYVSYMVRKYLDNCTDICNKKTCVMEANDLLEGIGPKMDPCEDSKAFACSNYERFLTEEDLETHQVNLLLDLKDTIESSEDSLDTPFGKMKSLYHLCMQSKSTNFSFTHALSKYMASFGMDGWPYLPAHFSFSDRVDSLTAYASYNQPLHHGPLIVLGPTPAETKRIAVQPGSLVEDRRHVESFAVKFLSYLGVSAAQIQVILADYTKMDDTLREYQRTYNDTAENQQLLDCKTPTIPLVCKLLKKFVEDNGLDRSHSKTETIAINIPRLRATSKFLSTVSDRTLANYLALQFVFHNRYAMNLLVDNLSVLHFESYKPNTTLWFKKHFLSRWRRCVALTGAYFWPVLAHEYQQNKIYLDKLQVLRLVGSHLKTAERHLNDQTWIPERTKKEFSEFIQATINRLDYTVHHQMNSASIAAFYEDLQVNEVSYLQSSLEVKKHYLQQIILRPHLVTFADILLSSSPYERSKISYQMHLENKIKHRILFPQVSKALPKSLHFASISAVIGQALAQQISKSLCNYLGCDSTQGHQNDATRKKFDELRECFVKQYSQFDNKTHVENSHNQGKFSENLSSLFSAEIAHGMIEKFLKEERESTKFSLPGLHYEYSQLLYIAVNKFLCEKAVDDEALKSSIGSHASPEIRVKQNSKLHEDVFHCQVGSEMNTMRNCVFFNEF